jgi:hypothetical protein
MGWQSGVFRVHCEPTAHQWSEALETQQVHHELYQVGLLLRYTQVSDSIHLKPKPAELLHTHVCLTYFVINAWEHRTLSLGSQQCRACINLLGFRESRLYS